jgi:hypothetical protein
VEAPFARDAETRQFTKAQKLVYGRRMNAKIFRKLLHRHHTAQTVLAFCQPNLSLVALLKLLTARKPTFKTKIFLGPLVAQSTF